MSDIKSVLIDLLQELDTFSLPEETFFAQQVAKKIDILKKAEHIVLTHKKHKQ